MANDKKLATVLKAYAHIFHNVVPFDKRRDKILLMNFTDENETLTENIFNHTTLFSNYINEKLQTANALYGIGGYAELRTIYSRSNMFGANKNEEPRRLHLGIDIWGKQATPVFAPIGGTVHSFKFNDAFGDYGATIVLQHQLDAFPFYTLYGHLSLADIGLLRVGQFISMGEIFAHFGEEKENGNWPPHLHFQIITDMENMKGDYPGVCKFSESGKYLSNCPDADIILQIMQYAVAN
jgi:murein DD-endopeptidase MepM/ murein hydrolase activator NlpD